MTISSTASTTPRATDPTPLRTDAEVLARVTGLIGPACVGRRLWVLMLDGNDRQLPVLLPITAIPRTPDRRGLFALERLLDGLRSQMITEAGPGSVVFALERLGSDAVLPADQEWADALRVACRHRGVALRGVFLSTDGGVRRVALG